MREGVWFILGLIFLIIEIFAPGMIALWLAAGCFIVALLKLIGLTNSFSLQLVIWVLSSSVLLVFWHRYYKDKVLKPKRVKQEELSGLAEGDVLGKRGTLLKDTSPSVVGKIKLYSPVYGLSEWDATSNEHIEAGAEVEVIGVDGTKLIVRRA